MFPKTKVCVCVCGRRSSVLIIGPGLGSFIKLRNRCGRWGTRRRRAEVVIGLFHFPFSFLKVNLRQRPWPRSLTVLPQTPLLFLPGSFVTVDVSTGGHGGVQGLIQSNRLSLLTSGWCVDFPMCSGDGLCAGGRHYELSLASEPIMRRRRKWVHLRPGLKEVSLLLRFCFFNFISHQNTSGRPNSSNP